MDQAVHDATFGVKPRRNSVEIPGVLKLIPAPDGPGDKVSKLNETGRAGINEQGDLGHVAQVAPSRTLDAKFTRQVLQGARKREANST